MEKFEFSMGLLEKMIEIRTVEELIANDFLTNKIFSFLHLSVGQESSAVGVCAALENDDLVMGNHRSHHHFLAKGGNLEKMIYEVYGDSRGCCKGFGGSMHMLDRKVGFAGSTPILGSVAPLGVGIGFYLKAIKKNNIAVIFIGDGAAEEGALYESINLASLFKIPILFVIEDNKYSVNSTHLDRKSPDYSYADIFKGLGASYSRVNASNVLNVHSTTLKIKQDILTHNKPSVLHLDVIRGVYGHSGPLKEIKEQSTPYYRKNDTIEYLNTNDCIGNLITKLISSGQEASQINKLISDKSKEVEELFTNIRSQIKIRI